jgi:hypothetical protein
MEESFIFDSLFLSREEDMWFGFTIITDLLPGFAVSLFLELLCPFESEITWWLSIIQLLCRILLLDSWFKLEFASNDALSGCPLVSALSDSVLICVFFYVWIISECYFLLFGFENCSICNFCSCFFSKFNFYWSLSLILWPSFLIIIGVCCFCDTSE